MFRRSLLLAPVALVAFAACGDAAIDSSSDFAKDSFANPTEHGALRFEAKNPATFDAEHRFHSWTFTLSASAKLDVRTELFAQNLDSVMYLYKRNASGAWGEPIAKNDDFQGNLWSRISKTFGAGEYLLKVKAYKTKLSGAFEVQASCSGDGCPAAETCSDAPLPSETPYTAGCAEKVQTLLLGPVDEREETLLPYSQRCTMGALVSRAADYYRQYWEEIGSWSDWLDSGEGDVELHVWYWKHFGGATTVNIDAQGDEDRLIFVFDAAGNLVTLVHDEQSPSAYWFCAAPGETELESPDGGCMVAAIPSFAHESDESSEGSGTTKIGQDDALPAMVARAVEQLAKEQALASGTTVAYSYEQWLPIDWFEEAAQVTLTHGTSQVSYVLGASDDEPQVFTRQDDKGVSFICQ